MLWFQILLSFEKLKDNPILALHSDSYMSITRIIAIRRNYFLLTPYSAEHGVISYRIQPMLGATSTIN